ncbi:MAG: cation transporter [Lachnospiraceae bacterium]|nr:cation transporter [Lachnospiraceae bacterium]
MYKESENVKVRLGYGMLCGIVGIVLNILLFAGKAMAGVISGSIAITADAFNNLSDAASSLITLVGFRMAGQKADQEHPFGHGRIEYIAGLLVSVLILVCAFELFKSSVEKIIHPRELVFSPLIVGILIVSILVKCYMFYYNRQIGRKIASAAMLATATDSLSDAVATLMVLLATLVGHISGVQIDGYCGALVALFICYAGYCAARDTISPLLGNAPDPEFVRQVQELVLQHEGILGVHDLVVHDYGPGRVFLSLHAEVPADSELLAIHNLIDGIEHKLRDTLHCNAVIHMDPVCLDDEETLMLKEEVKGYLLELMSSIPHTGIWSVSTHDFRLVREADVTKVLFDVVVPYHFTMEDEELVGILGQRIVEKHPGCQVEIEVDRDNHKALEDKIYSKGD